MKKQFLINCGLISLLVVIGCEKNEAPPVVNFTTKDTLLILGSEIHFLDKSENEPINWLWNFGGQIVVKEKNPIHIFNKTGKYDVSLKVVNDFGSDEITKKGYAIVIDTGRIIDIEGNVYKTIQVEDRWWMAENLATTKYNDETEITLVTSYLDWNDYQSANYSWYNNDMADFKRPYGALYSGYVVASDKICPMGWHVPTDIEWTTLLEYLGGLEVAGNKLKETGTSHWKESTEDISNQIGFTALPAGIRYPHYQEFQNIGVATSFWSSTEVSVDVDQYAYILSTIGTVDRAWQDMRKGLSIRCIKDE